MRSREVGEKHLQKFHFPSYHTRARAPRTYMCTRTHFKFNGVSKRCKSTVSDYTLALCLHIAPRTLYISANKLKHAHASHANCLRAIHCSCVLLCFCACPALNPLIRFTHIATENGAWTNTEENQSMKTTYHTHGTCTRWQHTDADESANWCKCKQISSENVHGFKI